MKFRPKWKRLVKSERGFTLVFWALFLPVMILMSGLIVDMSRTFVMMTEVQNIVDASALAGANTGVTVSGSGTPYCVLPNSSPSYTALTASQNYYNDNMKLINGNNQVVAEKGYPQYNPEGSANYSNGQMHVVAKVDMKLFFGAMIGIDHYTFTRDSWATCTPN